MKHALQNTVLIAALAVTADPTSAATVAEWNFNNTGTGTAAQRLSVAMGATSVASGLSVSQLNINASFTLAGFNNVPASANNNDGFGFGNAGTPANSVIFIHRANYFNGENLGVTTWGNPVNTPGVNTTVAGSPLNFTVTTDSLTTVTLNSVNIAGLGIGNVFFVGFQEAAAAVGTSSAASNTSATAFLTNPVVIGPNQTKTFTINLNSGNKNTEHTFNTITLDGTVTAVPEPSVIAWLPGLLGLAFLRRRRVQRSQA